MNRMMAPLCGPHKSGGFAGEKAARVRGSVPLGAAMDSTGFQKMRRSAEAVRRLNKYLPQRGMALAR